jgi:hypothetical protein
MPSVIEIVNGKPVVVGTDSAADLQPTVSATQDTRPKRKRAKPKPKNFFQQLQNDVAYEFKEIRRDPVRSIGRALGNAVPAAARMVTGIQPNPLVPNPVPVIGAGVADNVFRMGYSALQRMGGAKQADPSRGLIGQGLDQGIDTTYRILGFKPPSQQSRLERDRDMMGRDLGLNVGLTLVPFLGPARAVAATTRVGTAVKGAFAYGMNELASQFLSDNTGGGAVDLVNMALPKDKQLPGGLGNNVGKLDMIDSAVATFGGNVAGGAVVGGALALGGKVLTGTVRRLRAGRLTAEEVEARARLQNGGVIQPKPDDPDGFDAGPAVGQAAPQKPATFTEANTAMEQRLGFKPPGQEVAAPSPAAQQIEGLTAGDGTAVADFGKAQPAELPDDFDPALDPWDPDLPELTDVLKTLDQQDPAVIRQLDESDGSVTEQLQQLQSQQAPLEVDPTKRFDLAAMPTSRVDQLYMNGGGDSEAWAVALKAVPPAQLRSLASPVNSPELAERIFSLTGKKWAEQTTGDIRLGIESLSQEGRTVLIERLRDGRLVATDSLAVDPIRFQYKQGVDSEGRQIGASLSEEEAWNPRAEGIIEVWRDPADGKLYVVNGHNRLALAKEMGVPSLMVKEITATTPNAARAYGAISNIAQGQGNAFDAAKFIRDTGMTDPAQLKAAGMTGQTSLAKAGLALSKLPEDVFRLAVDGKVTLPKAVIIGESGLSEPKMRSMAAQAVKNPDMPDWKLRELGAMNRSTPEVQGDQGGLDLGFDFSEGMQLKADVVRDVENILRKDRRIFGNAAKGATVLEGKAANTIDRAGSKAVADEASTALAAFERMKYETGEVGDRLNQAVQQIADGQQPAAVARQVVDDLKGAIQREMDAAMGRPADPDQIDLLAPAEDLEAPEPRLTAAELEAAKLRLVARTAQDGEARPPTTPIPTLSAPPRVSPSEAIEDIQTRGALEEGSPGAQAMEDEIRLRLEQAESDALARQDAEDGLRDMFGYDERSFDEKKDLGMTEGWDDRPEPPSPTSAAGRELAKQISQVEENLRYTVETRLPAARARGGMEELVSQLEAAVPKLQKQLAELKQQAGIETPLIDDDVMPTTVMGQGPSKTPIADSFRALMDQMVESDRRTFRAVGELIDETRKFIKDEGGATPAGKKAKGPKRLAQAPIRPEQLRLTQAAEQPTFALPEGLTKAAPRYGRFTVAFESDLDRAAYILQNDGKRPSKSAPAFRTAVEAAGLDPAAVIAHGRRVKAALKEAARGAGTGEVRLPAQPWGDAAPPAPPVNRAKIEAEIAETEAQIATVKERIAKEGC